MNTVIKRLLSVEFMLKPSQRLGGLPKSKEAYNTAFKMAWPSAMESVLVSLIGSVDTMMVGSLGAAAIAAIGITNQPKFILLAMIFSLNVGVTAVVARRKGENDMEKANATLRQSLIISFALAFVMAIMGFAFARPILIFAGAKSDVINLSVSYFRILMVSIVFTAISLTINAAQRGVGNTKISMRTNLIANIFNIVFNYLLINGIGFFPKLGVRGAAIATVIGSFVGCVLSVRSLFYNAGFLKFEPNASWKFDKATMKAIINISGSSVAEQVFMRIGFFFYAKIVAGLGTIAFATHQICMNIINLSFSFGDGLSIASSSLVGQSLGAKRSDMAIVYGKIGQRMAFGISTILFVVFIAGRNFFMGLFTSNPKIIALGSIIIIIIAFATHLQTSQVVVSGCLRGAGDTKFVAMTSIVSVGVIRPILAWVLCYPLGVGLIGAWLALFFDQIIRLVMNFKRFSGGKWTKIEL